MDLVEASPEDLTDSLAFALLKQRKALQRFAKRPGHEPGMEDCQTIAKALVEHLKRTGVEKVVRRVRWMADRGSSRILSQMASLEGRLPLDLALDFRLILATLRMSRS
jgi:hypothetical protein